MAMLVRKVARASQPHLSTLADSLRPLLAVANAGSFHLRYETGAVVIEQNSFTGCDLQAIDAAVASAPAHTEALAAKATIDAWPKDLKAFARRVVIEINRLRQNPTTVFPAFTEAQVYDAIKSDVDTL
jgi:hypothetical protein